MRLTGIDHIGIAVSNLEESLVFWQESLGIEVQGVEEIREQNVRTAFLPIGGTEIELLEATAPESPIAKFIEKKGEGLHHIALGVDDIDGAIDELKARGVQLIDEKPRYGAGHARIAFVHPKAAHGVLLELCERKK